MKKFIIPISILLIALIVLFFPITKTYTMSGEGEILTTSKEKIGECNLSIEIKEVSCLLFDYERTFTYSLDDTCVTHFSSANFWESSDGAKTIVQTLWSEEQDRVVFCSVMYPEDLSFVVLIWQDQLYFLPNGTDMIGAEIPWNIV